MRDGQPANKAGWITWGDSVSGTKQRDYRIRGFTPLSQYGSLNNEQRRLALIAQAQEEGWTPQRFQAEWIWGPILRSAGGPEEFPLDQVVALRWFDSRHCPIKDISPRDLFPQLTGKAIRNRRCPQCNRNYPEVDGRGVAQPMANHLRIEHDFDMQNILAYGERAGIDFTAVEFDLTAETEEFDFGASEEATLTCDECGEEFSGRMAAAHLAKHVKTHEAVPA